MRCLPELTKERYPDGTGSLIEGTLSELRPGWTGSSAARELDPLDAVPFPDATEAQLAERQLLRRVDSKYVVPAADVHDLIRGLDEHYAVVRVASGSLASYCSLYFDTPELRSFHDHRRGRRLRRKIRIRHYPDRGLSFLEVKTKCNEDLTDKVRQEVTFGDEHLCDRKRTFLRAHDVCAELVPVARVDYRRMTLISLGVAERVTIDLGIEIALPTGPTTSLGAFAVIEIKQARLTTASPIVKRLVEAGHHQQSLSKYVAAVAQLHPAERKNRILPALRAVDRIAR